jgi:hypothetical protein
MKKAELFIILTVILGGFSVAVREIKYGDEHSPFLYWILTGLIVGLLISVTWIWLYYPRTSDGKFEPRAKTPGLGIFSLTALVVMCFFGMSLINAAFQMKKATEEIQNWPSVPATIEGQEVYQRPPGKTGPTWWAPTWSYSYEINGKVIHSHSTSAEYAYALASKPRREEAQAELEQRPIGSHVTAFYDPEHPELSVLDKRADGQTLRYLFLMLGILILGGSSFTTYLFGQRIKRGEFK